MSALGHLWSFIEEHALLTSVVGGVAVLAIASAFKSARKVSRRVGSFLASIRVTTTTRTQRELERLLEAEITGRFQSELDTAVDKEVVARLRVAKRHVRPARWLVRAERNGVATAQIVNTGGAASNVSVHPGQDVLQVLSAGSWDEIADAEPRTFEVMFDERDGIWLLSKPSVYVQWVDEAGDDRDALVPFIWMQPAA